jgi:hypothetical protein
MKYPWISWEILMGGGVGYSVTPPTANPFYNLQASGQIFKDDVTIFSSTSDTCFTAILYDLKNKGRVSCV